MIIKEEQREANKQEFLSTIRSLSFPEDMTERFISWIEGSDFFTAPASTKYHLACVGGLCQHTLNVINTLNTLITNIGVDSKNSFTTQEAILAAALHDLSKINYYEMYTSNKKVYSPQGTKVDDRGRPFDWVSVDAYKVKEAKDRFIFASHSQTSEFMARQFFPLTPEVTCAILHHMGPYDNNTSTGDQLSAIFSAHPLATLLHTADFIATHVMENEVNTPVE